jgi:hypothetical protein
MNLFKSTIVNGGRGGVRRGRVVNGPSSKRQHESQDERS